MNEYRVYTSAVKKRIIAEIRDILKRRRIPSSIPKVAKEIGLHPQAHNRRNKDGHITIAFHTLFAIADHADIEIRITAVSKANNHKSKHEYHTQKG